MPGPTIRKKGIRTLDKSSAKPVRVIKAKQRRVIRGGPVAPPVPGLAAAVRFLTKRDISGTAPGLGTRVIGDTAKNVSGYEPLRRRRSGR